MFDDLKELYYLNKTYKLVRLFNGFSNDIHDVETTAGYHAIAEDLKARLETTLLVYDDREMYPFLLKPLGLKYWLLMNPLTAFIIAAAWLIITITVWINILYATDAIFHLDINNPIITVAITLISVLCLLAPGMLACHKILNLLGKERTEKRINYLEDFLSRTAPSEKSLTLVKKNPA